MQIPGNAQEPVKIQESDKMKKSDSYPHVGSRHIFRLSGTGGTFAEIFTGTELFCGNRK